MADSKPTVSYQEIIKSEYMKCAASPVYFMKHYVKIQHPIRGTIAFDLYPFQEKTLQDFHDFKFNIILKSRQMGISTLVAAYSLWTMIFNKDKTILVIATKETVSKELISKVRFANDNLPTWLTVKCIEDNRLSLKLNNGSQIRCTSASSDAGRSTANSLLIIDEAAFISEIESIWASSWNTLSTGGNALVLSTPNGKGNWFHKMWTKAENKENTFNAINLKWDLHPERRQEWRDLQTKELGPKLAAQECFSEDVIIFTDIGPRKIVNINSGDLVLTHTGEYKPVIQKIKQKSVVCEISSTKNYIKKYVTENHPFLLKNGQWTPIKDIHQSDDVISFPTDVDIKKTFTTIDLYDIIRPKFFKKLLCDDESKFYINDNRHKIIHNRYLDLDYEFGYMLGLYLAEGSGNRLMKVFNFNYKTELDGWPKKLTNIIREKFGVDHHSIRKINNTGHMCFCSEIIAQTLDTFTSGKDCYSKCLSPLLYKYLNLELSTGIVDGYFKGDGCLKFEYYKQSTSASLNLTYDITYLLNILSINNISIRQSVIKGTTHIEGRLVNTNPQWTIKVLKSYNKFAENISDMVKSDDVSNNTLHLKLSKSDKIVDVYNLEVEDNHSYVTEYGVSHNCDCDFMSSGDTVIDPSIIEFYKKTFQRDPLETRGIDRATWIWQYPDPSQTYIIGADPARGDGGDFSACHVINAITMEQCAEYRGKVSPKEFGNLLTILGTEYNNALLVPERESVGYGTVQQIIDRGYPNLFYMTSDLRYVDPETQLTNKYDMSNKATPGFGTNLKTRPLIISNLVQYFNEKSIKIYSKRTLAELDTFIWKNMKAQAMSGYNDDTLLALAITLWVKDTALRLRQGGIDLTRQALSHIDRNKIDRTPVFKAIQAQKGTKAWQMSTGRHGFGNDNAEDLKWLL